MNYNLLRFTLFLIVLASSNAFSQCPNSANIDSIDQPTCTNPTGIIYLSGLPSGSWTINSSPAGATQSGSGSIAVIPGLIPGQSYTFTYSITSPACTSNPTSSVIINSVPNVPNTPIAGGVTQPTCLIATGSVAISNLPSTGGWTLTATSATLVTTTITGIGSTVSFTGLPVGAYTFVLTLNSNGCSSSSSNQIFINPPTVPSAPIIGTITQPSCSVPTGSVALSGLPNQAWTITTSPGAISTPGTGNSTLLTGLIANTSFTFTVTNNVNSCVSLSSLPAQINIAPIIPPVPTATSVQPNCPIPSGTINVSAPLGAYTYSIDGISYQISPIFSGVPPGNYTVYVKDNSSGCISSNGPTVINALPTPPNITLLYVDSISCNGLSDGGAAVQVTSGGTSPFVYSWSPMGGTNDTVTNLPLGNYNIVVVDAAQCVVVQSFTIAQPSALTIFGSSTPIDCELGILGTVDVDVSGGEQPYLYTWNTPSISTDSISNLDIGSYSVNVTDNNGCSIAYGTQIGIINDLLVNINPADTSINPGTSFVANAYSLGSDYVWTPIDGLSCTTCPNPVVSPDSSGIYYVSVSDDNGCQGSDSMSVTVKLLCGELYVPTIFSPNGIGPEANNKLWVFGKVACIKRFSFQIYDRWGELVFESINLLDGWDGNFKERPATVGNYVYKLSVLLYDDSIYNASGSLTLVR